MSERNREPVQNKKKPLVIAIAAVVALAALVGGILLGQSSKEADPGNSQASYEALKDAMLDGTVDPYANTVDFEELQKINPDIYAWITVPGTNVDYPVLTNEEDSYYLYRSYDGKDDRAGSIFTDKYNSKEFNNTVTVLYGHTLRKQPEVMFGTLHQYMEEGFMKDNPYVYIYLPDKTLKYQIFSAVAFNDSYILSAYDTFSPEGFESYISDLNASMTGVIDEDVDVKFGKFVITLSTCINEFPDQRLLVNAVLLEQRTLEQEDKE